MIAILVHLYVFFRRLIILDPIRESTGNVRPNVGNSFLSDSSAVLHIWIQKRLKLLIKESIHSTITVSINKQFEMAQPFFLPSLAGNFGHVALEQYWFRFQTFHVLNLTHWIKYMKSLMSESIRDTYFNLEPFFLPRLAGNFGQVALIWSSIDSDVKPFMCWT